MKRCFRINIKVFHGLTIMKHDVLMLSKHSGNFLFRNKNVLALTCPGELFLLQEINVLMENPEGAQVRAAKPCSLV